MLDFACATSLSRSGARCALRLAKMSP